MSLALLERPDERLPPLERLEVLTDPGSLQLLRTRRAVAAHGRARPARGRRARGARARGRAPGLLLRPGRLVRRRLARRGPRADARGGAAPGRPRARAGDRLRRVGGRAHAGGHGGAVGLRCDLPRARPPVGAGAADLDRVRPLRGRLLLRPRAERLRDHEPPRGDVPDRPGGRLGGDRRGRRHGGARRHARA